MIGVAGGYCTGKNVLVGLLEERGFEQIDVDGVGHAVLEEPAVRREIVERFGSAVLGPDGGVDRRRLGALVFGDRRQLSGLEAIVHPRMVARVEQMVGAADRPLVINAAILLRMGLERLCDFVVCVRAPLLRRLFRAAKRDGLGPLAALRRIASQRGICSKTKAQAVDIYYVNNNRGLDRLEMLADQLLSRREFEVR